MSVLIYIYYIYMSTKNHFAKNEILLILLIPPLSGELPTEAKKSEFRHEHRSYSKIKVNNQICGLKQNQMKDQLKANYYIDLLENIHPSFDTNQRIVNGYQLMPNNSLNIYEIYTKSNLTQILEVFGIGKYT